MCFDADSSPPVHVIAGATVSHESLTLNAADGNTFRAFLATPEDAASRGVVVYPDVRGLYRFYEELALRFAERGIAAIAFDYFGRTAGTLAGVAVALWPDLIFWSATFVRDTLGSFAVVAVWSVLVSVPSVGRFELTFSLLPPRVVRSRAICHTGFSFATGVRAPVRPT